MKLVTKLTLIFLLLTIVPLAVVGFLAYDNGRRTIEENVFNHLSSINIHKEDEFELWIETNQRSLRELSRRPLVRDYTAFMSSENVSNQDEEYQTLYAKLIEEHFGPTLEEEGGFLDLSILRAVDGMIIISTDTALEGKYRESASFFLEGKQASYVDEINYSITEGELVLHISTPILDDSGELIAVLAGHADLAEMSDIMTKRSELNDSEDSYLVNKFNFFVTEPRFGHDFALKKATHTEGVDACLLGDDGEGIYLDYRGEVVLGAYHWLPDHDLCLLTEVDQTDAFQPIHKLRNTIAVIAFISGVVVTALSVFYARSITRPVDRLIAGVDEIGSGNLEHRIHIEVSDELGLLAESFNQMTVNLAESQQENIQLVAELKAGSVELERRVEERTKDLKAAQLATLSMMEDAEKSRQIAEAVSEELRAAQIATMNMMMDVEDARTQAELNEVRFRSLFEESPIALLEEDFSAVRQRLTDLTRNGTVDLKTYFAGDNQAIRECSQLIKVISINQASVKLFKAHNQKQLLEKFGDIFVDQSLEILGRELLTFWNGEMNFEEEFIHQTMAGEQIWTIVKVSIAPGYENSWEKVFVSIVDISEQKKIREAVLREKDFSDRIINSIPGVFYMFDDEGKFLRWNKNFSQVLEYSDEEIAQMHPIDLFEGEGKAIIAERIQQVFVSGQSDAEAEFVSKSGVATPYYFTGFRMDTEEKPILIGTGIDITERQRWENQLSEKADELARSNEELERFAYVASHDLQEPLRMVASYLQLLERRYADHLDQDAREFIAFAVDGATRMKRLINDLLEYSRVGTRGQEFDSTNLNLVLGRVHVNLQAALEESGALISKPEMPTVLADESQLVQLFQNLLANAIKFSKEGDIPRITVSVQDLGHEWQFAVKDNGIGFDQQYAERIFVIFQRLHSKEEYAGTGIGLAVSKRIVERHGGDIWAESEPGEGATFYFTMPKDAAAQ
ncbi:MAG: PAS domain S-box protein [Anaerolineales bacterium]|nr:PAS domain S-box protein [Anaerolineales bacterium]